MKGYTFVVDGFDLRNSQSPDGVLLQMSLDQADYLIDSFSQMVKQQRKRYPDKQSDRFVALAILGSLFLDLDS
jgi:ASC-1-like (ASCH) protein